ncbi:MAG: lipopolysaccharide heptosyltransferase II [Gammaproteobacteria bacterium]|nr:lipopolysaccharide heptosyltransferase II [Gammaproteobacteria bacterium]
MVMAQSLCKLLRQQQPDCAIDMLAPGWSLPVVARMPEVRRGVEAPFAHGELNWSGRRRLGRSLREVGYDQAIVLPRSFKSALVPFHARIPHRTGFRGEMRFGVLNDRRELDRERLPRTVDRYLALGQSAQAPLADVPFPRLQVDARNQSDALARLGLTTASPVVGMMPGAEYGPAKQWPVASFAELAHQLCDRGYAVWIFGSEKDKPLGEVIASHSGASNLAGETSLADAIDLIALCSNVVTNDSGLMHIAAATGTRVIAIYGSSSPNYTPPLTDRSEILWLQIDCSPCFDRTCRFGHYRCLRDIKPTSVADLIDTQD